MALCSETSQRERAGGRSTWCIHALPGNVARVCPYHQPALADIDRCDRSTISSGSLVSCTLVLIFSALGQQAEPSAEEFLSLIEVMIAMDRKFTLEQLEQMARQRKEWKERLSPEELAELQRHREEATAELHRHRQRALRAD